MARMDTPEFTTPSADLNQALQVAFNLGAGQSLETPGDLLAPVRRLVEASGRLPAYFRVQVGRTAVGMRAKALGQLAGRSG